MLVYFAAYSSVRARTLVAIDPEFRDNATYEGRLIWSTPEASMTCGVGSGRMA